MEVSLNHATSLESHGSTTNQIGRMCTIFPYFSLLAVEIEKQKVKNHQRIGNLVRGICQKTRISEFSICSRNDYEMTSYYEQRILKKVPTVCPPNKYVLHFSH